MELGDSRYSLTCHPLAASSQPTTVHLFFLKIYLQETGICGILKVARVPKFFLKRVSPTHLLGDILGARATLFFFLPINLFTTHDTRSTFVTREYSETDFTRL